MWDSLFVLIYDFLSKNDYHSCASFFTLASTVMIQTRIQIDGMACEMCEAHIRDVIRKHFPEAQKIRADHKEGLALVVAAQGLDVSTLKETIRESGYRVIRVTYEPYQEVDLVTKIKRLFS